MCSQVSDNCYYIGYVAGHEAKSTAAVSTCVGLRYDDFGDSNGLNIFFSLALNEEL